MTIICQDGSKCKRDCIAQCSVSEFLHRLEPKTNWNAQLPSLDECTCSCHRTGAVHFVACCTGVSKFGATIIDDVIANEQSEEARKRWFDTWSARNNERKP
jgi:hypothetical protein